MNVRKRLIELILSAPKVEIHSGGRAQGRTWQTAQGLADHLLANGVVVIDLSVVSPHNRPMITHFFGRPIDDVIKILRMYEEEEESENQI